MTTRAELPRIAGVDGCRGGWAVAVREPDGRLELHVVDALAELFERRPLGGPALRHVAIDMPIGLPDSERVELRECDREARVLLGSRRASIFAPPSRWMLEPGLEYDELRKFGLSKQSFYLFPKLREVDEVLAARPRAPLVEAHPELAFTAGAGAPCPDKKSMPAGAEQRLAVLERCAALHEPRAAFERAAGAHLRKVAALDDFVDALVLVQVAADLAAGTALVLPTTCSKAPKDAAGRPMRIASLAQARGAGRRAARAERVSVLQPVPPPMGSPRAGMRSSRSTKAPVRDPKRERILSVVDSIPSGSVATFGQVADEAGLPRRARLVGKVMGSLPADGPLPWWRVVNAAGRVGCTVGDGTARQIRRLRTEGVKVSDSGRLKLERYRWRP